MKKLVIAISAAIYLLLILATLKTSGETPLKSVDTNTIIVEKSLNGIPYAVANKMIQAAYVTNIDTTPANTQIWFSKRTVVEVYNLLMHEDSIGLIKPDGVRIYFSSSDTTGNKPTHSNNSVVVVSTYWSGRVQIGPDMYVKVHTDYFEHDASAALFAIRQDTLAGITTHYNDTTKGAMLYNICNCDNRDTCVTSSDHFIKRSEGEAMVQAFQGLPFKSKSEWFDINMLIDLYYEMSCTNEDGIRIYFARGVSGITSWADVGKARYVIVTTVPGGTVAINNQQVPIYKDRLSCACTILGTHVAALKAAVDNAIIMKKAISKIPKKGGNDNGELCPTNCDGVTQP